MRLSRMLAHTLTFPWTVRRHFSSASLGRLTQLIAQSEQLHRSELRLVIEGSRAPLALWHNPSPRSRAVELFAQCRVWDTEENTGVLLYVCLADRAIEIVADRGINRRVAAGEWQAICQEISASFRQGAFEQGLQQGIQRITALMSSHFPADQGNPNELPDAPLVL